MAQGFPSPQQIKIRTAILVFLKGSAAPLVLYVDNPQALYEEMLGLLKIPGNKIIEKETSGPIRHVAFASSAIYAVAMQDEQYFQ